ncbi:putative protein RRP5 [Paratrimastix pyriformis]|uniref:Uncharacterized protein n=1 Tax=Paratrimastix pyriformis TaxID=342808 RepID=A0ABQ8UAN3_9EUKA|nr:putative protein RRP5 [Paratrimastix pyriformis]
MPKNLASPVSKPNPKRPVPQPAEDEEEEVSIDGDSVAEPQEPESDGAEGGDTSGEDEQTEKKEFKKQTTKQRRAHRAQKIAAQRSIEQRERELSDPNLIPHTTADYERFLVAWPNCSFLWVRFMAHHLALGEVDPARAVAERALKVINVRDDAERLNVWLCLLNLEHLYGTEATLTAAMKRALQACDQKPVYRHLIALMEHAARPERADAYHKDMLKKNKQSCKC